VGVQRYPGEESAVALRVPMATHLNQEDVDAFCQVVAMHLEVAGELVRPGLYAPDGRRIGGTAQPYAVFIGIAGFLLGQGMQLPLSVLSSLLSDGVEALFRRRNRLGDDPKKMPAVVISITEGEGERRRTRPYATIVGDEAARREAFQSLGSMAIPGPGEPGYVFDPDTKQWRHAKS